MKKTIDDIIRNRHSARSFTDYIIPDQELMEILSAGIMAPSGKNRKPWRFVIVRNREAIKNVARKVTYSRFIRNAHQMILIYAENDTVYPFEKKIFYCPQQRKTMGVVLLANCLINTMIYLNI